ncbi:hypothetical protein EYF80_005903 [Liparis tanakae]|uniref:Uncharacterized protein n=1 Tax=Liparis tanakae TaxID=230148 RepID=A0A4Z2J113_9TELE|nr:hypothetical protein EYF80_005903 [Liparis tanakae]
MSRNIDAEFPAAKPFSRPGLVLVIGAAVKLSNMAAANTPPGDRSKESDKFFELACRGRFRCLVGELADAAPHWRSPAVSCRRHVESRSSPSLWPVTPLPKLELICGIWFAFLSWLSGMQVSAECRIKACTGHKRIAQCHPNNTKAYRVNASRKSFAQNHDIWTDFLVVHSQAAAGPRQAGLHLISNPQHLGKTQSTRPECMSYPERTATLEFLYY